MRQTEITLFTLLSPALLLPLSRGVSHFPVSTALFRLVLSARGAFPVVQSTLFAMNINGRFNDYFIIMIIQQSKVLDTHVKTLPFWPVPWLVS